MRILNSELQQLLGSVMLDGDLENLEVVLSLENSMIVARVENGFSLVEAVLKTSETEKFLIGIKNIPALINLLSSFPNDLELTVGEDNKLNISSLNGSISVMYGLKKPEYVLNNVDSGKFERNFAPAYANRFNINLDTISKIIDSASGLRLNKSSSKSLATTSPHIKFEGNNSSLCMKITDIYENSLSAKFQVDGSIPTPFSVSVNKNILHMINFARRIVSKTDSPIIIGMLDEKPVVIEAKSENLQIRYLMAIIAKNKT
jgi:hypothetical protein